MAVHKTGLRVLKIAASFGIFSLAIFFPMGSVFASFGSGAPTVATPSIFTLQSTKPKVDGASGAFTQNISIDIPPGRNGVQPSVSLQYNSQDTEDSIVGYGWSLSIPYIQRINKTGTQDLYGTNAYFASSLDGELATTSASDASAYAARVDDGSFRSYTYATSTNKWTMYDKKGTRYLFGSSSQSQQSATTSPSSVYKWMLEEIRDTNDNYVKFTYNKDGNQIYPYQIIYTGHGSSDGPATITFATSTRPDQLVDYNTGFKVWTNYRISQITVSFNGTMVRQYALSYTTGDNGYRSLLSSVQETGKDDSGTQLTLPATTFSYVNATSTAFYTPSGASMAVNGQSYVMNDTNGNGINDVNEFYFNTTTNATGSKMYIDQSTTTTNVIPPEWWSNTPDPPTPVERGVRYIDVNGDGKADIARGIWDDVHSASTQKLYINAYATSTGYAWNAATTSTATYGTFASPSAYWKFDESSGPAADSTSNGNTLTNNNSVAYGAAKINNGANLVASTSQSFTISNGGSNLDPSTGFSTSFWVKLNSLPGTNEYSVISKGDWTSSLDFRVMIGDTAISGVNSLYVGWTDNGQSNTTAAHYGSYSTPANYFTSGDVGTWVHIAIVADATHQTVTVYKNGVATTLIKDGNSNASTIYQSNPQFDVGRVGTIRYLDGSLDEMAFWKNYLLTSSDVSTLYNGGSGESYPVATSTPVQNGIVPSFEWSNASKIITTGLLGDVNGDRLPDYVLSVDSALNGIPANSTYLGNGSAWNTGTTTIFVAAKQLPTATSTITNSMLIDINGDGLDDWVYSDASSTHALLNTATGWESTSDPAWDIATSTLFASTSTPGVFYDRGIRFFDINGDGLPDFIRSYHVTGSGGCSSEVATMNIVMLNTGHGWATSTAYTLPAYITTGDSSASPCTFNEYGNWNGNGQMKQDVISKATYPKGGSTDVSYGLTTQLGGNPSLPYSLLAVTSLINHDGRGSNEETDYTYGGGLQYLPFNVIDRKFGGFATTTETRSDRVTTTYFDQGDTIQSSLGEQSDGYAEINHPFRIDISTPSGTLLKKTLDRWDTIAHGNSTFVGLGQQLVQSFASDGTHRDTATDYQYSSTTDDLLEMDQYGEVTGNSNGTFSDVSGDSRTTLVTYAASSSVNMSVPDEKKVLDNSSATSTDSRFYYDSLPFGSVNVGNQTKEEDWISGSTYASSTNSFNSYGLATQSTDRRGNATSYVYDTYNLYPATTTNPLSQSIAYTYNYSNGKAEQATDPNGRIIKNTYDAFGRLTEVDQSSTSTPSSLETKTIFQFTDNSTPPSSIHESDYLNAATTTDAYDYYDGLNRLIQERKSSENSATTTVTDLTYNTAGLLATKSLPYFSTGTTTTSASTNTKLFTTYAYDPLGRVTTTVNAVGTTTNAYSKWTTSVTDPLSNLKSYTSDAYNNLVQVVEPLATSTATTTYAYDAANDLTKITDNTGNVRNFTYNGLGRQLTAEDLHVVGDGTFGNWSYTYDAAGNLTSQTDPKSQVVNRTYDALNRMLTEDYTGQSGIEVTDTYDSCTDGIGSLCTASSTAAKTSNSYDILGRVSTATTTVNSTNYVMSYVYDRQGNITSATYPNGAQVAYTYNPAGQLETVQHESFGGSFTNIIKDFDYAPTNLVSQKIFGSGATTTLTYDANNLYRLNRIATYGAYTAPSGASISPHPNGYWKFDESSGTASDASGNGNTLTNNNSITFSGGKINNASNLVRANSQYFSIPSGSSNGLDPTTSFSVSFWVKLSSLPNTNEYSVISRGDNSATYDDYRVMIGNTAMAGVNSLYVAWSDNGSLNSALSHIGAYSTPANYFTSGDVGTWVHIAIVADATNQTVTAYKNGVATTLTKCTGCNGSSISQSPVRFDVGDEGNVKFMDGSIDELAFWKNYLLTSSDVSTLYNSGSGVQLSFDGGYNMLQDLNYAYDADGNILSINNVGSTTAQKAEYFEYDPLNRLTSAYTTSASSSPYTYAYSYDSLGNITNGGTASTSIASVTTPTSYWKYDESSGPASDSVGTNALTNNNAITYSTGELNNAANFVSANSQYFSIASSSWSNLDPNSSFSLSFWVKLSSLPNTGEYSVISKGDNGATYDDYRVMIGNTAMAGVNSLYVAWSDNGSLGSPVSHLGEYSSPANYFTSGDVGTWVHIAIVADATNQIVTAYKNGVATTLTKCTGCNGSSISQSPVRFDVGDEGAVKLMNGSLDEMRFWKNYKLTISEVSALYQGSPYGSNKYTYAGTGYANPDAVTSIGNGSATTTYAYDNNGNLISSILGATTTLYTYDYANRLIKTDIGANSATTSTTYAYDAFGNRVFQGTGTATTTYPMKYYSIFATLSGATTTATTTEYVYGGDTLLATIDNLLINGTATGTPTTHYIHPDHLGSTNIVSDSNMNPVQTLDYYPFGATRVSTNTGASNLAKQFIGQYFDAGSSLNYLQNRYYNSSQGQFTSEDPVFLALPSQQNLQDPQSLNSYSYSDDNPIIKKDPSGRTSAVIPGQGLVYDYNGTNESICCSAIPDGSTGFSKISLVPPTGTANGYLAPNPSNGFGTSWATYAGVPIPSTSNIAGPGLGSLVPILSANGGYQNIPVEVLNPSGFTQENLLSRTSDPTLQRIIQTLFKSSDELPGGTAGAVRYTQMTGEEVGGSTHIQAAADRINWLKNFTQTTNSEEDIQVAKELIEDLGNALQTAASEPPPIP